MVKGDVKSRASSTLAVPRSRMHQHYMQSILHTTGTVDGAFVYRTCVCLHVGSVCFRCE